MEILALGVQQRALPNVQATRLVFRALAAEVRRDDGVKAQLAAQAFVQDLQPRVHEEDRGVRIGDEMLDQAVTPLLLLVNDPVEQRPALRNFDLMLEVVLLGVAEGLTIGDEELQVARVGRVDRRAVEFIDDAA